MGIERKLYGQDFAGGDGAYLHCFMDFMVDRPRIGLPPRSFVFSTTPLDATRNLYADPPPL